VTAGVEQADSATTAAKNKPHLTASNRFMMDLAQSNVKARVFNANAR
jgi:hypothetical protein